MINASFPQCIIEVIHTHLSFIGICFSYDSEPILNGTQNAKTNWLYQCQSNIFHY